MKLLQGSDIAQLDRNAATLLGISSYELMKRAAGVSYDFVRDQFPCDMRYMILAGPGNNGGDALVVARLMAEAGVAVEVCHIAPKGRRSVDCQYAYDALMETTQLGKYLVEVDDLLERTAFEGVVIDGLFGVGLTRPLEGTYAEVVEWVNREAQAVISIDIPSGLYAEPCVGEQGVAVEAMWTVSFHAPKLSLLMPECGQWVRDIVVRDIGIPEGADDTIASDYYYTTPSDAAQLLRVRRRFSHKGTYGHGLLIAGSHGMMGAAMLASKAALKGGIGLLTLYSDPALMVPLAVAVPEAMMTQTIEPMRYTALAIGPGLSEYDLRSTLEAFPRATPMILDATALNLLALQPELFELLRGRALLTPHPKEFDRLFGAHTSCYGRISTALIMAQHHQIYILLKGAYSALITPAGEVHFNSSGNAGMATAGSGDVLTGLLLALVAQGYTLMDAARLGMYLHGRAGDILSSEVGMEAITASDLVQTFGRTFAELSANRLEQIKSNLTI